MATIVTRAGKGSPLTNNEVDANFENLNAEVTPLRHSIRPSLLLDFANSKQLDPRITFSRASTGTYYDGKTFAKAEENLFTYSQEFDNAAWTKSSAIVTANATTAPDGTTTADELIENASSALHRIFKLNFTVDTSKTYTQSVFVKANTRDGILMRTGSGGIDADSVKFDLGTQTTTNVGVGADSSSITDVGNGWYRCSMTFSPSTNSFVVYIGLLDSNGDATYTGDGSSLYLWGAQLEQRDSVTAYTPTTSQPITNYIPVLQTAASGAARFDHDPVTGESKGLLIEEQRTNLLLRSEEFDNAYWTKTNVSIDNNVIVAPDGTLTGDKLGENASNATHRIEEFSAAPTIPTVTQTLSIYAKVDSSGTNRWLYIKLGETTSANRIVGWFNLSTGVVGTASNLGTGSGATLSIYDVGNNWYRCVLTGKPSTTGSVTYTHIGLSASDNTDAAYQGDGYSGVYIWGAQLEAGSFPTSYIKTTSAQATRNEDEAEMSAAELAKVLNVSEGTAYIAANFSFSANTPRFIATIANGYNRYMGFMYLGGVAYFQPSNGSINSGKVISVGLNKQAISWSGASSPVCYNATNGTVGSADTGTGVNTFVTYEGLNVLRFGNSSQVFGEDQNGWVTKFALYPKALSTSELQALTEE